MTDYVPGGFELVQRDGVYFLRYPYNGISVWYRVQDTNQLASMGLRPEQARYVGDQEFQNGVSAGAASNLFGMPSEDYSAWLSARTQPLIGGNAELGADPHVARLAILAATGNISNDEFSQRIQDSAYWQSHPGGTAPPTAEQQSAKALITSTLDSYGLGELGEWMWKEYQNGVPLDAIWLEMRSRPEYKARFPGMDELTAKGRAISEAQYIEYERNAVQIMRAAGIGPGVMDSREQIGGMIGGEVSLKEFEDRLGDYQKAVFQTPQEVRDQLRQYYGVKESDILSFFLDPDKTLPQLEQRFLAAQAGGVAVSSGYGNLSRTEAERLGVLGLSRDQMVQGFDTLYDSRELFNPLLGTQEGAIDKDTQFGAVFEGRGADAERIRRRAEERKAQFAGGGTYATSQQGISGLGSAK